MFDEEINLNPSGPTSKATQSQSGNATSTAKALLRNQKFYCSRIKAEVSPLNCKGKYHYAKAQGITASPCLECAKVLAMLRKEPVATYPEPQPTIDPKELAAEEAPEGPDDEAGNVLDSVEELWRPVPDHPRYQLSNRGRMRGYMGLLLKPHLNGASALSAKYQLWSSAPFKRSASFSIRQGMLVVWGIRFTPTVEWVKEVQAQVLEEATSRIREKRPAVEQEAQVFPSPAVAVSPAKAPSVPSRPSGGSGGDGMPCPWASGKLDTLPPGVATWECPEMDPMTDHGRCRVWVCVPEQSELQRSGEAA